jgi:ArsR family transcriptional regulator, arsenate/arsenite/antimonite-responsive transcriptional repressor
MKDSVFKALGDPTRRKILRLLNGREMTAGEIARHFTISLPSLSHHFNALKEADLVTARREGQNIYYALNTTAFQDLLAVLLDIFRPANEEEGAAVGGDGTGGAS